MDQVSQQKTGQLYTQASSYLDNIKKLIKPELHPEIKSFVEGLCQKYGSRQYRAAAILEQKLRENANSSPEQPVGQKIYKNEEYNKFFGSILGDIIINGDDNLKEISTRIIFLFEKCNQTINEASKSILQKVRAFDNLPTDTAREREAALNQIEKFLVDNLGARVGINVERPIVPSRLSSPNPIPSQLGANQQNPNIERA